MEILCLFRSSLLASIGRRTQNWALKQSGRNEWLKVQYIVIWYPIENLLHLYESCSRKLRETLSWVLSKHDL